MKTLFAKIFGWFVLTLLVTVIGFLVVTISSYRPEPSEPQAPFSMLLILESREARNAFESGGAERLKSTLDRFRAVTGARQVLLLNSAGTDLLSGQAQPDLIAAARRWQYLPFFVHGGSTFARFSGDGRYCLVVILSPFRLLVYNLRWAHLFLLSVALLLCYAFAYRLTEPLRRLQKVLERFGGGELGARSEETRRDELGGLSQTFNRMADRIQTLLDAEHRLLLDVSHELRSPLARLSVAVELARSGETSALPLDRIQREADRLNALISQMLEVTRSEGNPALRKLEPVQLDELVSRLCDDCTIEARIRGCTLSCQPPPQVSIEGDGELLRRAIENVLRNAIRYAPRDTTVEVTLENGGGRACVRIRDYGPGVPEEAISKIFNPFYRVEADRNRTSGGVGLGLSIARRAVELHRGTLRASNVAPGLLVEIELPV